MRCATPQPCIGPRASVCRISRSSVPCNKSVDGGTAFPSIFDNRFTLAPVDCQGKEYEDRKMLLWRADCDDVIRYGRGGARIPDPVIVPCNAYAHVSRLQRSLGAGGHERGRACANKPNLRMLVMTDLFVRRARGKNGAVRLQPDIVRQHAQEIVVRDVLHVGVGDCVPGIEARREYGQRSRCGGGRRRCSLSFSLGRKGWGGNKQRQKG